MKQFLKRELCCGCGACVEICHKEAIHMVSDREGFWYPKVNKLNCDDCGQCKSVCPMQNEAVISGERIYYGVRAKNDEDRYSSSSGGVFSILAEYVLGLHGVVYGAGYDKNMNVIHQEVTEKTQLERIKRTKYVQSSMKGVYHGIEEYLMQGRWVLFCGTPCQAHALRLFLKRPYDKLILIDLVCYGVPSPGIWSNYVGYLEHMHKGKMREFLFRDKRNHDYGHMCSYIINDREHVKSLYEDKYCSLYFSNYSIRPSCYQCKYCTVKRGSDFTIGDFWGIEQIKTDMDDGMGVSLMIAHTEKARRIWEELQKDVFWFECKKQDVLQPRLQTPVTEAKKRHLFMVLYRVLPFSLIMKLIRKN